jgi:branched-chain amino acid aminotransferase
MERAHVYGDLLFETMKMEHGQIAHFDRHMKRLANGMQLLHMHAPDADAQVMHLLKNAIEQKNSARVRLIVQRSGSGFYLPDSHEVSWHAEFFPLPAAKPQPLTVCVYTDNYKACTPLSNLKSGNALVYVLAAIHAQQMACDDALVLNEYGRVCEATASNIFIREGNTWITPPLSEGCVAGIMREVVLSETDALQQPLSIGRLRSADEVMLTNAIHGKLRVAKIL